MLGSDEPLNSGLRGQTPNPRTIEPPQFLINRSLETLCKKPIETKTRLQPHETPRTSQNPRRVDPKPCETLNPTLNPKPLSQKNPETHKPQITFNPCTLIKPQTLNNYKSINPKRLNPKSLNPKPLLPPHKP